MYSKPVWLKSLIVTVMKRNTNFQTTIRKSARKFYLQLIVLGGKVGFPIEI